MKGHAMNPQIHAEERLALTHVETTFIETEVLAQPGFTPEEIISLLWLRQWYQNGGSDRAQIVHHLEILKGLVLSGKLES